MNTNKICRNLVGASLLMLVSTILQPQPAAAQEETFPLFQVGTRTYTNVTVTTKSKTYIFILHSAGMANIKLADLSPEVQEQLGYAVAGAKSKGQGGAVAAWAKEKMALVQVPQVRAAERQLQDTWREQAASTLPRLRSANPMLLYAVLGAILLIYLFFCYCAKVICEKTGKPPGVLLWMPTLQVFPLLRAAGMSPVWFLAYVLVLPGIVAQMVWSVKIAKRAARASGSESFCSCPSPTSSHSAIWHSLTAAQRKRSAWSRSCAWRPRERGVGRWSAGVMEYWA